MKIIAALMLATSLFAIQNSKVLPQETKTFIDSFDCFNHEDRTVLYAYTLNLKYRMENVNDIEALKATHIEYWRLLRLVGDVQDRCLLDYKFDDVLEETITQTDETKKALKKLRREESRIHMDGDTELSQKTRNEAQTLKKELLAKPPKYTLAGKSNKYDLAVLKNHPDNTIPKKVFDDIIQRDINNKARNFLLTYAYSIEQRLRLYDQPEKRRILTQKLRYLDACTQHFGTSLNQKDFYTNSERKLANRIIDDRFYGLKEEFLPKEIEEYCEHNITQIQLSAFIPRIDATPKANSDLPKFAHSNAFIDNFNGIEKKYLTNYLSTTKKLISKKNSGPTQEGLRIIRLQNCMETKIPDDGQAFMKELYRDLTEEKLQESYKENVLSSVMWWAMTIAMKAQSEGNEEKLKEFLACESDQKEIKTLQEKMRIEKEGRFTDSDRRSAIFAKSDILKYYAETFHDKPTPDLNNERALKAGIVPKEALDSSGNVTTRFGERLVIAGTPKGGISLTYYGIPKGEMCTDFVSSNHNDIIHFNNKRYEGIDYILINGKKLKLEHFVRGYAQRLCNQEENLTVSFVKEEQVRKHAFTFDGPDAYYDNMRKIEKVPDNLREQPILTGKRLAVYRKPAITIIDTVSKRVVLELDRIGYLEPQAFSPDERWLAVNGFPNMKDVLYVWDLQKKKNTLSIERKRNDIIDIHFLQNGHLVVTQSDKVEIWNIEQNRTTAVITPPWASADKDTNIFVSKQQIMRSTLSPDMKKLYLSGAGGELGVWEFSKNGKNFNPTFLGLLEEKAPARATVMAFDEHDPDILLVGLQNGQIDLWNVLQKKKTDTLQCDANARFTNVTRSSDGEMLLATNNNAAYLWELPGGEQFDIIQGHGFEYAHFLPESHDLVVREQRKGSYIWKRTPPSIRADAAGCPELFIELSFPLYEAAERFTPLQDITSLKPMVEQYIKQATETLKVGNKADSSGDKSMKTTYLKALRSLQKNHDHVVALTKRLLIEAMQHQDHATFALIVNTGIDYGNTSLATEMATYYKKYQRYINSKIMEEKSNKTALYSQQILESDSSLDKMLDLSITQAHLKTLLADTSATHYAFVVCSGKEDWITINGTNYDITSSNLHLIAYTYVNENTENQKARIYLFPLQKAFKIEGALSNPRKHPGINILNANANKPFFQATSINEKLKYTKKLIDIITYNGVSEFTGVSMGVNFNIDIDSKYKNYVKLPNQL